MGKYSKKDIFIAGVLLAGFVMGILFINLWGDTYFRESSILNGHNLELLRNNEINLNSLFLFLLLNRGKWYLLFWLIGHTVVGIPAVAAGLAWLGFSAGGLLTTAVVQMGISGSVFGLAVIMPQGLIYAPLIYRTAKGICYESMMRYRYRRSSYSWQREKEYMLLFAAGIPMLILAAALEGYANPWVMQQVLRLIG